MLGFTDFLMASGVQGYRYLRISYGANGFGNTGLGDLRFYVGSAVYPPYMTGNNAPSPYVASSNDYVNGYEPYKAFDTDMHTDWAQSGGGAAGWIMLDCGAGNRISPTAVSMRPRPNNPSEAPSGLVVLSGSNDGVTFTTLTTFTPATWSSGVTQTFQTGLVGYSSVAGLLTYPPLTGRNTAIVDASSVYTGNGEWPEWWAFDGNPNPDSCWVSNTKSNEWLRRKFSAPVVVTSYSVASRDPYSISAWMLQGWTGSAWVTLDTRTGQGIGDGAVYTYTLASPGAYTEYRIYITAANSAQLAWIGDFKLYGNGA